MNSRSGQLRFCLYVYALIMAAVATTAAPTLDTGNPLNFFTNVAARLLSQELSVNLNQIQIYPTNQYTPAVHRLLQVAANVYDATSTNFYPSVFRPVFSRDSGGLGTKVFNTGYTNVPSITGPSDPQFVAPMDASDLAAMSNVVINMTANVYGVPWIIGAKKGFPNFNELAMDTAFQLTRKLQATRNSTSGPITNFQMFILNITNQLGVECWNSYTNSYPNPVTIYAVDYIKNIVLTNDVGFGTNQHFIIASTITVGTWQGSQSSPSFQIPLNTPLQLITNSIYRFNQGGTPYLLGNLNLPYETSVVINGSSYPQPHWGLMVTNNLRVIMLDGTNIIDYVQLSGPNGVRDLTTEILTNYDSGTSGNDLWDTNFQNGVPRGIANQIGVSLAFITPSPVSGTWDQTDPLCFMMK